MILAALSQLIASFEERAEGRQVYAAGLAEAPTLRNYIERQNHRLREVPAAYEAQLKTTSWPIRCWWCRPTSSPSSCAASRRSSRSSLAAAISGPKRGRAAVAAAAGFGREQAMLRLSIRGVSPALLEPITVQERDLASQQSRSAQLTLDAAALGADGGGVWPAGAALDTTAGERERGSLEPLLMNPAPPGTIVVGKWVAVSCVGLLVATLSSLSFLPAQLLIRSDSLQALFQYGLREAALFMGILLPFSFMIAALIMAIAIRCKTFKEAQASATVVVMFVSLAPTITVFNPGPSSPGMRGSRAVAEHADEPRHQRRAADLAGVLSPWLVAAVLCFVCLSYVARTLRSAATR